MLSGCFVNRRAKELLPRKFSSARPEASPELFSLSLHFELSRRNGGQFVAKGSILPERESSPGRAPTEAETGHILPTAAAGWRPKPFRRR